MRKRYLIYILSALMLASCMADEINDPMGEDNPTIEGTVSDQKGKPLEHIKVTLVWGNGAEATTAYTSSEGTFKTDIPSEEKWADITISDIDGQENGGEFESVTDKIMFHNDTDKDELLRVILNYRLTPSTPSENSPQS